MNETTEMIKEFNKGDLLYIDRYGKAQWGFPEGYPYKGMGEVALLENASVKMASINGMSHGSYAAEVHLADGDKCVVSINDEIYPVIAKNVGRALLMGNAWLALKLEGNTDDEIAEMGIENTGESFCIFINKDEVLIVLDHDAESVVFGLSKQSETIHPMVPKFLPQANQTTPGIVKQMPYLPDVEGSTPTAENFNQLLRELESAGLMRAK